MTSLPSFFQETEFSCLVIPLATQERVASVPVSTSLLIGMTSVGSVNVKNTI